MRAVRSAQETAILDMTIIKGRTIDALALATKQPRKTLERLFLQAAEKLADHFDPSAATYSTEEVA